MKKITTIRSGLITLLIATVILLLANNYSEASSTRYSKDGAPEGKISDGYDFIDFGETYVGQWQWPIYIYIDNIGTEPLIISAVNSSSNEFIFSEFSEPVTVAPMESFGLIVSFSPNAAGHRAANIEIFTNDPITPILTAQAQGFGFDPPIDDTFFNGLSFVSQQASKTILLKNATPYDNNYDIFLYFSNENSDNYERSIQVNLVSGETAEVVIPIDDTNLPIGNYQGEFLIQSGNGLAFKVNSNWNILEKPTISSNATLKKTIVAGQTASDPFSIGLTNPNNVPLEFSISQKYANLNFVNLSPASGLLGAQQSAYLEWIYDTNLLPAGIYNQELFLNINNPELALDTLSITLTVIESGPILSLPAYQSDIDFAKVWLGSSQWPICLYVENSGTEPLVISEVTSSNPNFQIDYIPGSEPIILNPGSESGDFYIPCINFRPTSVGELTGEITIVSNDPVHPVIKISLTGTGVASPAIQTFISDTLFTHQQVTKIITLQNKTSDPVEYYLYSYSEGNFMQNFNTSIALMPGETKDIEIILDSHNLINGVYEGELSITGDEGNMFFAIPVLLNIWGTIQDFSITNYKTGRIISTFNETFSLDAADPDIEKFTIQVNTSSQEISSVQFMVDGRLINIDNTSPYTINHWILPSLSEGKHIMRVQGFSKNNARGKKFEIKEATIDVINLTAIVQFIIVDRNGDSIKPLVDGDVINVGHPDFDDINIAAITNSSRTKSVRFKLNGFTVRIDNHEPYTMSGISYCNDTPRSLQSGSYTLTATPYLKYHAWGSPGIPLNIHFTIVNEALTLDNMASARIPFLADNTESIYQEDQAEITIYPNPAVDELNISINNIEKGDFTLKIVNTNGQVLHSGQGNSETNQVHRFSTNQLGMSNGMYYIQVLDANGHLWTRKILKK